MSLVRGFDKLFLPIADNNMADIAQQQAEIYFNVRTGIGVPVVYTPTLEP